LGLVEKWYLGSYQEVRRFIFKEFEEGIEPFKGKKRTFDLKNN